MPTPTLFLTLLLTSTLTLALANPLPNTSPNPLPLLHPRTPIPVSTSAFADWPTNVVMLGGSQSYGLWIPPDGTWYYLSALDCLDLPAYAIGPCDSPTIDQIGVATGNGPCGFVGINGWSATIRGAEGDGWTTVGPPQRIVLGRCGLDS